MMIDWNQLEALARYQNLENPVVSLYLNVTPPRSYESELNSLIHIAYRSQENRYTNDQLKQLKKVLDSIETHIFKNLKKLERTRLVVIFADADGLWQEYQSPVGLPNSLVVEADPYIRPLTMLLDEFDRYCVLVTDARKARIFSLYLGDFEEYPDVFVEDNVPNKVRAKQSMTVDAGGTVRGGLGDKRIERHIEDHVHRHLKHVADRTLDFFKEKHFSRLIVGGPDDKTRPWLKDHLHTYLKERLAGEFNARPDDNAAELKDKAIDVAWTWKRNREHALIQEVFDHSGPGDKGVLGVEPTLEVLTLGQVHTLLVHQDFETEGYVCPEDHLLSTYLETCPFCEGPMHYTQYLADEMVEEAISQNSEVEHIFTSHEDFEQYGVGAKLRFTL